MLHKNAEVLRNHLPELDDEILKTLFESLNEASNVSWFLQMDIVAELHARSRHGSNAVKEISKFLGIPERRVFELSQIHKEIILKDPSLRDAPLDKTHFVNALRTLKTEESPVDVLHKAVDEGMSANGVREYVDKKKRTGDVNYFIISRYDQPIDNIDSAKQVAYYSPEARLITVGGVEYLELRGKIGNEIA